MIIPTTAVDICRDWINTVAQEISGFIERFRAAPTLQFFEIESGDLLLKTEKDRGGPLVASQAIRVVGGELGQPVSTDLAAAIAQSNIELFLQPGRFLFRPLELPDRAVDFIGGIVRSQIDRLTPWTATNAAFGWSKPCPDGKNHLLITVAASAVSLIRPYVDALKPFSPQSIAVFAQLPGTPQAEPINVWNERAQGGLDAGRIRKLLIALLLTVAFAAALSLGAAVLLRANLATRQSAIEQRLGSLRSAATRVVAQKPDTPASARLSLAYRKAEQPPAVIVLENLSRILPDHTSVTELRLDGNKLRLVGSTSDAPSLIGLLEQSHQFARASFFAPTTRSPTDPTERFHIEAMIANAEHP